MGAMPEEIEHIKENLLVKSKKTIGGREFISGNLHGIETVLTFSRWGKVASATTAANLINCFNINYIIFTGVAGAISEKINIGDIVIGDELYQHDMDAQPFFKKHQIPLTQDIFFKSEAELTKQTLIAANNFTNNIYSLINKDILQEFNIEQPKVFLGKIATGDQFITNTKQIELIKAEMPDVLAVEMEGGAVAQVCKDHDIPFIIIRTISDKADHSAIIDFPKFINSVAKKYSLEIIKQLYSLLYKQQI